MIRAGTIVAALLCGTLAAAAEDAPALKAAQGVRWCALDYQASKFFVTLDARLELQRRRSSVIAPTLLAPRQSAGVAATGAEVLVVRLVSALRDEHSDLTLTMDPVTGAALQQRRIESGSRSRVTTLRYAVGGVLRTRVAMASGEEDLPSTAWSRQPDLWRAYPSWAHRGLDVSDPAALFYLVAASKLAQPGDALQLPMFSNDQLLLVDATVHALSRAHVEYLREGPSGRIRVEGRHPLLRIALDARPLDPGSDGRDFELAGLRGDVVMLLDPIDRLPVEVAGDVPYLGRVTLKLQRAEVGCLTLAN